MKRILIGLTTLGVIAGVTLLVTNAFFSDTETSAGNIFTAGSLDLKVDSECTYNGEVQAFCTWSSKDLETGNLFFNFLDVKPGDSGEDTISLTAVDNDAWLCAYVQNLANNDNSLTEPESIVDSTDGVDSGELQDHLYMTIWNDTDCDNKLDSGTQGTQGQCIDGPHAGDQTIFCQPFGESECIANQVFGDCRWIPAVAGTPGETILVDNKTIDGNNGVWPLGQLAGNQTTCLGVSWNVPDTVGNVIQSDSVTGDVAFYTEQVRNNPDFVCGQRQLPPTEPSTAPPSPTPTPIPTPTPTSEPNDEPETLTVHFLNMGADPQYGYVHNYAQANVSFVYDSPANPALSGTITATGLKPYATYQVKFEGIPTCIDPINGNNLANEYIGYAGRWWDNTTSSNLNDTPVNNDAFYLANSTYHGGTHCITGYLVWNFFTADSLGSATKVVAAQNSYHVLWCDTGVCGNANSNAGLTTPDAAHPALQFCPAAKVYGEIERFTCGGLSLATGTYNLKMILTEESFHQAPGTWTAVMQTPISFKLE